MKAKYFFSAFMGAFIVFTGCSDDVFEEQNFTPWEEGDGIVFGARAGFEKEGTISSRTIYTGEFDDPANPKYERVDWIVEGSGYEADQIGIYCNEATVTEGNRKVVEYKAIDHSIGTDNKKHDFGTFVPTTSTTLQWGDINTSHQFYAFYPSESQMQDFNDPSRKGLVFDESDQTIIGRLPVTQLPIRYEVETDPTTGITTHIARPQMRNAVMFANTNITPSALNGKPVALSFKSIVTALELDFVGTAKEVTLYNIIISSAKHNLAGKYKADLNSLDAKGYPTFTSIAEGGEAVNQVIIPLQGGSSAKVSGFVLKRGEHLKVTAFLLPHEDLDDVKVTVEGLRGQKTHALNDVNAPFTPHLKYYYNNIKLPEVFNSSKWLSLIDDNVYLSQLSIPGTGGSYSSTFDFTKSKNQAFDEKTKRTQTRPIQEQWDMGIRCFEISCSEKGHAADLGGAPVQVNKEVPNKDKTVRAAITDIANLAKQSQTEFAIIILNYQPQARDTRDPQAFVNAFSNFLSSFPASDKVKLFKPDETLGNVRGKIMFVLRATSNGEDGAMPTNVPTNCLLVHGWGSLQDKWANRGYKYYDKSDKKWKLVSNDPVKPGDNVNIGDFWHPNYIKVYRNVERNYLIKVDHNSDKNAPDFVQMDSLTVKGASNFDYPTNKSFTVWAQEWPRVVKGGFNRTPQPTCCVESYYQTYDWVRWWGSYEEKYYDAVNTFNLAVQHNGIDDEIAQHKIYINSLCGYYVMEDDKNSMHPDYRNFDATPKWGHAYGDIPAFSDDINQRFFTFMWKKWQNRITGPMGIVMMNRVGIDGADNQPIEATYLMPKVVISNNFTFPLKKAPASGK